MEQVSTVSDPSWWKASGMRATDSYKMEPSQSLSASYFDALYQTDIDLWKFATSEYEAEK